MVAVTSQDDAAATMPVKLTPTAEGQLALDRHAHDPVRSRHPVPAGDDVQGRDSRRARRARPATCSKEAVKFTFETPPPTMRRSRIRRARAAAARRADVRAVRSEDRSRPRCSQQIEVTANGKAVAIALLDAAEIAKDKQLAGARRRGDEGRAGRPLARVPRDRARSRRTPRSASTIEPGTPSAEGPNTTKAAQSFDVPHVPAAARSSAPSAAGAASARRGRRSRSSSTTRSTPTSSTTRSSRSRRTIPALKIVQ